MSGESRDARRRDSGKRGQPRAGALLKSAQEVQDERRHASACAVYLSGPHPSVCSYY